MIWSELGLVGYDVCLARRRSRVRFLDLGQQEKLSKIQFPKVQLHPAIWGSNPDIALICDDHVPVPG